MENFTVNPHQQHFGKYELYSTNENSSRSEMKITRQKTISQQIPYPFPVTIGKNISSSN